MRKVRRKASMPRMAGNACFGLLVAGLLAIGGAVVALHYRPIRVNFLRDQIADVLSGAFGGQHKVAVRSVHLMMVDGKPGARLEGMDVRDAEGGIVMSTSAASVSFDPLSLLGLRLAPTALTIAKLDVRLDIQPDGSIAIATGDGVIEPDLLTNMGVKPTAPLKQETTPESFKSGEAIISAIANLEKAFSDGGLLSQLQAVTVTDGGMVIRHLGNGPDLMLSHIQVVAHSEGPDGRKLALSGIGPHGPLRIEMTSRRSEKEYRNSVTVRDVALTDLTLIAGLPATALQSDPKVAFALDTRLDAAKTRAEIKAAVQMGSLVFSTDGTPDGVVSIDRSTVELAWASDTGRFDINSLRLVSGGSHVDLAGQITPAPATPGQFAVDLKSSSLILDALTKTDQPLTDLKVSIAGSLDAKAKLADLSSLVVENPNYRITGRVRIENTAEGPGISWGVASANVPIRSALRIWPPIFAADVRHYLTDNMTGGTIQSINMSANMPPAVLQAAIEHRPGPDDAVHGDYALSNVTMTPVDGLPPLQNAEISGVFTGRTSTVNVQRAVMELGNNRRLALSEGKFFVADAAKKPTDGKASFRLQGSADSAADLMARPPLRPDNGQIIDPAQVKGTVDIRATVALPLVPKPKRSEIVSTLNGTVSNLSVEKAFGNEKLEAANLTISNEKHLTTAKGDGKLFGAPASISLRQLAGEPGEVQVQFSADDTVRAKRSFAAIPGIKGPIGVTVKAPVQKTTPNDEAAVTLDLTKTTIEGSVPGWTKPAGKPAKASFTYQQVASGAKLDNFILDGSSLQARGSIVLEEDGSVKSARLDPVKLSPSDALKVEIDKTANGMRTVVRGNSFDVRPFLRGGPEAEKPLETRATRDREREKELDLDLKVAILSGYNGEAMANAELRVVNAGPELRQFSLSGRFTGAQVVGRLNKPTGQGGVLTVASADAGAFLRFVDIYPKMIGGHLNLDLTGPTSQQSGVMVVRDFVLRNEPALRSVVGRVPPGGRETDVTNSTNAGPDGDVPFTKLRAEFLREPTRITFKDSVMWGSQVGGSVNGTLDYGRDKVNLTGTFVPAYQLNNMFAQVPVLGALLGGNQYEGLFAVSFQIAGKVSAPVLRVSPLSAIAPGFLRKLFEFRQQGVSAATPDVEGSSQQ